MGVVRSSVTLRTQRFSRQSLYRILAIGKRLILFLELEGFINLVSETDIWTLAGRGVTKGYSETILTIDIP